MKRLIFMTGLMALMVSCSTLVDKVEKDKNKGIRKVAIVGFHFDRERPTDGVDIAKRLLGFGDKGEMIFNVTPAEDSNANHAYSLISKRLQERMNVEVLTHGEVANNSLIKQYFAKKNDKVQLGVLPIRDTYDRYEAKGIPMGYFIPKEDKNLKELCKSLKVDAIVFVQAAAHLDKPGIWTLGIGRLGSETDVSVTMWNAEAKDFTLVLNERGDLYKFSDVSVVGYEESTEVETKSYQSFESAVDQLVDRI